MKHSPSNPTSFLLALISDRIQSPTTSPHLPASTVKWATSSLSGVTGIITARALLSALPPEVFSQKEARGKLLSVRSRHFSAQHPPKSPISLRAEVPAFLVVWRSLPPCPASNRPLTLTPSLCSSQKGLLACPLTCLASSCLGLLHLPFFSQNALP